MGSCNFCTERSFGLSRQPRTIRARDGSRRMRGQLARVDESLRDARPRRSAPPPSLRRETREVVERAASTTLLSEDAAYLISEILTDVRRPELPDNWKDAVAMPRLAWKTGTSYGRRDAWSVGYNRQFTVGVWVGNFDGRGVRNSSAFRPQHRSFSRSPVLPGAASDGWIPRPVGVSSREVCALSGALPTAGCPHRVMELALRDRAPLARCGHHVAMDIDDDTGLRLCSKCRRFHPHHQKCTWFGWPALHVSWAKWFSGGSGPEAQSPFVHRCSSAMHPRFNGRETVTTLCFGPAFLFTSANCVARFERRRRWSHVLVHG